MKLSQTMHLIKTVVASMLVFIACKQAGYQVLKPATEPVQAEPFTSPATMSPTARVEVIDQGVSVTWTYVGNKIQVRPSADTLDPDHIAKSTCENPGIVSASYDLGDGSKPLMERTDCSSLAVAEKTFAKAGTYFIQMQVKSADNELAWASMTLQVVAKGTARDQIEGGFTIHAKPLLANVGDNIQFTGVCELKGKINVSWDFVDSTKGDGLVVQHAYAKEGQYRVTAVCSSDAGKSIQASVTVVVIKSGAPKLPDVEVPVPSKNPNIPAPTKPNCNPTQGPCQDTTQAPTQSSKLPTQKKTIWYYDPYCGCYYHY
jgi:hypothetical protein